ARSEARAGEATRHFSNALHALGNCPPDLVLPESDGMTAGRLAEIITTLLAGRLANDGSGRRGGTDSARPRAGAGAAGLERAAFGLDARAARVPPGLRALRDRDTARPGRPSPAGSDAAALHAAVRAWHRQCPRPHSARSRSEEVLRFARAGSDRSAPDHPGPRQRS